ncbi:MAG: hypothetical protein PHE73_08630 [Sulfurovaceae bacterium]|nr:hypothetical protein [Sulfurovaceae bacterium]
MNYLIISQIGLSFFLVPKLNKEKDVEKIYFHIVADDVRATGKGMENLEDYSKLVNTLDYHSVLNRIKPDNLIIIIDDVGLGETGKHLRMEGYKVIGGTPLADKIEIDRDFGQKMVKGIMEIPETYSFNSFDSGINFLKGRKKDEVFYFKPNDADVPKEYTYKGKDIIDLIEGLKNFKEEWEWKESFQLQKEVKGQLMDFSAMINSKGQILPNSLIYYFENKPVMNDDIGPQTGGATAVEYCHKLEGQFYEIFTKLTPKLIKDGYVGQIAINSIISEEDKKPYFIEFCGRWGYPSFPLDITLLEETGQTVHSLFVALTEGTLPTLFPTGKIGVTTWVGIPPYPYKDGVEKNEGVPIKWDKKWDLYFYPYYVKYDENKGMVAAGVAGEIVQVTCVANNLPSAVDMLYNTYIPTLSLKNMLYRTDAGVDAKKRMIKLKEMKVI